jgi:eukaryotic-like serine/threonine-protein kinase
MTRIGPYELRELLGEGGIGRVYAAYDTVLQREVAIKSLRPELLSDSNFLARFRAEATSLARLNHPNITTVHTLINEGRNLYMVMELVRGETLENLLKRRDGALGVRESLAIMGQSADGLAYAHSMGVIHRDIKPANLMITGAGLVKIMDFGIARARGSQRLTRTGSMVGTLAYMAPEQLRGEPGDERSDLYSLAIVLYEILSGATPFSATSDYELMQAQIHARPPPLSSAIPGVTGRIERALMKALAKKPDQRFATLREFKDALGASASSLAATAAFEEANISTEHHLTAWIPTGVRLPLIAGGLLVAVLLLWGAMVLLSDSGSSPQTMNNPPARAPSPSYIAPEPKKKATVEPVPSPSNVAPRGAPANLRPNPLQVPPVGSLPSPSLSIK